MHHQKYNGERVMQIFLEILSRKILPPSAPRSVATQKLENHCAMFLNPTNLRRLRAFFFFFFSALKEVICIALFFHWEIQNVEVVNFCAFPGNEVGYRLIDRVSRRNNLGHRKVFFDDFSSIRCWLRCVLIGPVDKVSVLSQKLIASLWLICMTEHRGWKNVLSF